MNFKEYVTNDISNVFINNDEFSEVVKINETSVSVVEDSDKLEYRIKKDFDGLIIGDVLFYISESEYKKIPQINPIPTTGQAINYNGKAATITNVNKQMGIYEIIIQHAGGY